MSVSESDARMMARALQLARRGLYTTDPNPRVGCVIVKGDNIIGEGWHERAGEPHAEIKALRNSGQDHLYGATVYVTLEPCCHHGKTPPCTRSLIQAGAGRVVVAMLDPNPEVRGQGIAELEQAGIPVDVGLMEHEARNLNPGFIQRMEKGRPLIRIKLAASLDGRTALTDGESKWITDAAAREDVQHWRARSAAILTGVSTVIKDDPLLTVRLPETERQPLRIILDSTLRTPPEAQILHAQGGTLIITATEDSNRGQALRDAGAEIVFLGNGKGAIDLVSLTTHLASREINELHVEAGATLCGALLKAQLVDELVLYLAPHLMGSHARGMFNFPALESMAERIKLEIRDVRAVGKDWRFVCKVLYH
ncbi:MAG: bifunctional diaminohydroxyphosphoribosylaminopyrimidine deaminase/5-amino-6-(5-phosphoribosylamino)uracil reductase RibD [Gammaproteobacteria bacterium]|nr:bifunctional diaminohydroxyphosphoribosylaminopyrimidine deaminase/5-amino-6-(5-phosphoribosylamino)uracil reductase RibD [Gammaproteobacteria bacterium]